MVAASGPAPEGLFGWRPELSKSIEIAAQSTGDKSRGAIPDRTSVNPDNGEDSLACGGNERLARGISLFEGEGPLLESEPLCLDRIDHNRPRDTRKYIVTKRTRNQNAVGTDNPG